MRAAEAALDGLMLVLGLLLGALIVHAVPWLFIKPPACWLYNGTAGPGGASLTIAGLTGGRTAVYVYASDGLRYIDSAGSIYITLDVPPGPFQVGASPCRLLISVQARNST
jgi:hypothetical protein